ncbi:nicotinamidase/pyrazinamidase [Mesoplasma florum L1]|uniref:nicotinamidase n=1 Tax=Mesoplasma florum (strain ATCC 33453 / NBRC 100688 / NCTC 11704 / L1) TaxID=265311 RepID=Q6F1C6_MESFL|nr:isochorismatase family protein [Mesoplasma florum]AAT75697.1 nicotinamidase/pyrazinamidase [Mesoplasma florum L1]ATI73980.1 nicotinamidase/pyrazinamidase [Mesoplasma florum]AVN61016.1 nicotinamidase/pyrazinamidase [Mesoplasma florum]
MNKALIIVDYQYDFVDSNGKLYVHAAESKKTYIEYLIKIFNENNDLVVATKDMHPLDHYSFAQWGPHCVVGTKGTDLYFDSSSIDKIIEKGKNKKTESYSAFFDEKGNSNFLDEYLRENNIQELTIVGVALEVCVKATFEHAIELGYKTNLDLKGCAGFQDKK